MTLLARARARLATRPLLRFVALVIALLPACFGIWYAFGAFFAAPAILLAKPILLGWMPGLVEAVELRDAQLMVLSAYGEIGGKLAPAEAAGNQLGYPVNTRALSYSIPFFAALHFATPQRGGLDRFGWGLLVLWLLLAAGIVATTLKNLLLGLGGLFLEAPGVPPPDLVALAYNCKRLHRLKTEMAS